MSLADLPRFYEVARLEHDGRLLVCYGASDGGYMIANEEDVTRQSVVLTNHELRWLAELWRPSDDADLQRILERLSDFEVAVMRGAEEGETPEIRAWCALTLDTVRGGVPS